VPEQHHDRVALKASRDGKFPQIKFSKNSQTANDANVS